MKKITKNQKIDNVLVRWNRQYKDYESTAKLLNRTVGNIRALLSNLPKDATEKQVEDIIGNSSWTSNECNECGKDDDTVIRLGTDQDYEPNVFDICIKCLNKAVKLI